MRGAEAGRGLRYDVESADDTVTGAALAADEGARPYADPIFWAAFQVMGW